MAVTKIKHDADTFDKCQIEMATAIVTTIKAGLHKANLPDDQLKDLVAGIAFDVCCILDASQVFNEDIFPVVTFQAEGCADDEVISNGGSSHMHEYLRRIVEDCFPPKPATGVEG